MAKKTIFKEKQHFFSNNLKIALAALSGLAIFIVVRQYLNPDFNLRTRDLVSGVAVSLSILAGVWFLLQLHIKTAVTKKGIEYKMTPFHHRKRLIRWDEIKSIHIVSIPRYASWQPSFNNYMMQKKFTFSGRNGISVETCDGEQLFIGSSRVKELKKAIEKAGKKFELYQCEEA